MTFALVLMTGAMAACGDDDDDSAVSGDSTDKSADEADATIDMHEYAYTVSGTLRSGGTIHVANTGKEFHMLGVAKLKPGKTYDDAVAALKSEGEDDDAATYDEISMPGGIVGPGNEADVTAPSLGAGDYVIACFINVEGEDTPHFLRGMTGQFTVTDDKAPLPEADATYEVSSGKAVTGPSELTAGHHVLAVHRDADGGGLEPGIFKLDDGKTVEDFANAMKAFEQGPLPKGAPSTLPGEIVVAAHDFNDEETLYLGVDLEPGTYVLASSDSDVEDQPLVPVERIEIKVT